MSFIEAFGAVVFCSIDITPRSNLFITLAADLLHVIVVGAKRVIMLLLVFIFEEHGKWILFLADKGD